MTQASHPESAHAARNAHWQPTACILCECNCGIVVQLDRMLSRTTALVRQTQGWGASLLLKGVTPEFPGDNAPLLLAAQVGKRETVAGRNGEVTALQLIEIQRCKEQECGDWLAWSWHSRDLTWGEPYSAKQ